MDLKQLARLMITTALEIESRLCEFADPGQLTCPPADNANEIRRQSEYLRNLSQELATHFQPV